MTYIQDLPAELASPHPQEEQRLPPPDCPIQAGDNSRHCNIKIKKIMLPELMGVEIMFSNYAEEKSA